MTSISNINSTTASITARRFGFYVNAFLLNVKTEDWLPSTLAPEKLTLAQAVEAVYAAKSKLGGAASAVGIYCDGHLITNYTFEDLSSMVDELSVARDAKKSAKWADERDRAVEAIAAATAPVTFVLA